MQRLHHLLVWPLLAVFSGTTLPAAAVVNPYVDAITNRNLFALKAPPSAEELAALNVKPPEALPKVLLTGITTLMGGKRALLRVQRLAKPPEPAKEIPLILAEGSPAEEEVQVLEIDVAAGTVKISNRGTSQLLDITKDSPKAAPAPPVAAAAGVRPGGAIPLPGGRVPPPGGGGGIPIPPRPVRGGGGGAGGSGDAANPASPAVAAPALGGGWSGGGVGGGVAAVPQISHEEQTILIEAQRLQGGENVIILPPTELQEIINQENNPNPLPPGM